MDGTTLPPDSHRHPETHTAEAAAAESSTFCFSRWGGNTENVPKNPNHVLKLKQCNISKTKWNHRTLSFNLHWQNLKGDKEKPYSATSSAGEKKKWTCFIVFTHSILICSKKVHDEQPIIKLALLFSLSVHWRFNYKVIHLLLYWGIHEDGDVTFEIRILYLHAQVQEKLMDIFSCGVWITAVPIRYWSWISVWYQPTKKKNIGWYRTWSKIPDINQSSLPFCVSALHKIVTVVHNPTQQVALLQLPLLLLLFCVWVIWLDAAFSNTEH